jgi:hypothetical protein
MQVCPRHGLRKARATILAERGATDRQLMAVFGWKSEKEATKYTEAANRKRLAAALCALRIRMRTWIVSPKCLTENNLYISVSYQAGGGR